ncbi:tripartite tricarboxylate transporter TctB family protein [Noviherbaspirillum sp. CPCC 100848]|uniref:Tripartite tricarboxylate transporter TctB family protein n=1 Tax=Noviherbaspirillum album TaxID=3080276 RepID=A0ABU6J573_9BURK|nr:tripartite tricarboxylate transporter TctB family protein [Noviherbaspirillum sp. CPCC 100848]MEC4718771.1 tripartite tricarboxylate transporter TctB family protein [Noviherbaspirillum sp. CPCC 100848]
MTSRSPIVFGELLVSLGLIGLGIFTLVGTQDISAGGGYSQVGPRAFPNMIGAGLLILGGILTWQAVSGGWRNVPEDEAHHTPDWMAFGILSAAVLLHMAAIAWAGFILASTFLFILIARGFGSRRLVRDIVVGVILSAGAYFIFTRGLGLNLPAGLLGFLGGA